MPVNYQWLQRIILYANNFQHQINNMQPEQRMQRRFDNDYNLSKRIADSLRAKADPNQSLVLIPSSVYFKKHGIKYNVPEPAVFYYYTGIKSTWPGSDKSKEANWIVKIKNNRIIIDSVVDPQMLRDSINAYKKNGGFF